MLPQLLYIEFLTLSGCLEDCIKFATQKQVFKIINTAKKTDDAMIGQKVFSIIET